MTKENGVLDLSVSLFGRTWKNPLTTASGTFSLRDTQKFYNPTLLGAITTKGVSAVPWKGNPTPRIAETYGGMLNAIGLENVGVDRFRKEELPLLLDTGLPIIVNLAGHSVEEYVAVAEQLEETEIDGMELNISCPNIRQGGLAFGTDPTMAEAVTRAVRQATKKSLIVKLSPNVTDITKIARAVEAAGADGISMINTLMGMKIDVKNSRPVLANCTGGLSGPAIKPVAVYMVHQVRRAVKIPIIGMGGILTGEDAAEFLLAGADAVAVGTAALIDPEAPARILEELREVLTGRGFRDIAALKSSWQEKRTVEDGRL